MPVTPLGRLFVKEIFVIHTTNILVLYTVSQLWYLNYILILLFSAISPLVQRSHNSGQFSLLLKNSSNLKIY